MVRCSAVPADRVLDGTQFSDKTSLRVMSPCRHWRRWCMAARQAMAARAGRAGRANDIPQSQEQVGRAPVYPSFQRPVRSPDDET